MFTPAGDTRTRTVRTQDRILDAARSLLAAGGADACSMRAVAERSGVTAGAIYRHFRDKEALIEQVVALAFQHYEQFLLESIVSQPVGSFARIAALGDAYIRFAAENEEEFKIIFMPQVGARKKVGEIPGMGGYQVLRRCIVEAIESGAIRDTDPDLAAFYLWSRVHGIVMLLLACDLSDELDVEGGANALNLFQLTRTFVTDGLKAHE
jgi:AcrR family transcriptional regulator